MKVGDLCLETAPLKFLTAVLMIPQDSEVREQDTKMMGLIADTFQERAGA